LTPESIAECQDHFGSYFLAVNPDLEYYRWQQEVVAPQLDKVITGEIDRIALIVPFQMGKSEFCTIHFAAFWLGHYPKTKVMSLSYNAALAEDFGYKVREIMNSDTHLEIFPGSALREDSKSKRVFHTEAGGLYFANGFQGGINGRGATVAIIDDPNKNRQEAMSEAVQRRHRDIYKSTIRTRLQPGGRIIIVSTPWVPGDLLGWRLKQDGAIDVVRGGNFRYDSTMEEVA